MGKNFSALSLSQIHYILMSLEAWHITVCPRTGLLSGVSGIIPPENAQYVEVAKQNCARFHLCPFWTISPPLSLSSLPRGKSFVVLQPSRLTSLHLWENGLMVISPWQKCVTIKWASVDETPNVVPRKQRSNKSQFPSQHLIMQYHVSTYIR